MFEYILTEDHKYRLVETGQTEAVPGTDGDLNDVHALFDVLSDEAATLMAHGGCRDVATSKALHAPICRELHLIRASQLDLASFNSLLNISALPGHRIRALSQDAINV